MNAQYPVPGMAPVPAPKPKRSRLFRWSRNALITSVLVHLLFAVGAAFIVAIRSFNKPVAEFVQPPPPPRPRLEPRKLEMRVKMKNLQKSSSRPKLQPRMLAQTPSDIALPEIPIKQRTKTKVQRNSATLGAAGVGQGIGGGFGTGLGGGASFFGLKGIGSTIVFVVDLSASMSEKQLNLLKKELAKSIRSLPQGVHFQIICFAGPVWFFGDKVQKSSKTQTVVSGGKKHVWPTRGGATGYYYAGGAGKLPVGKYRVASMKETTQLAKQIEALNKNSRVWGTTWEWPLLMAMQMKPELIYFMTDGAAGNMPQTVKKITALNNKQLPKATIHTIGMVSGGAGKSYLQQLAKQNGGQFKDVR